jgi:hypothetical protein
MDYTRRKNDPVPEINRILVDENNGFIEIEASDWNEISWITSPDRLDPVDDYKTSNSPFDRGKVVGVGKRINFRDPQIKNYLRAEITRIDGEHSHTVFSNPFGIRRMA